MEDRIPLCAGSADDGFRFIRVTFAEVTFAKTMCDVNDTSSEYAASSTAVCEVCPSAGYIEHLHTAPTYVITYNFPTS
jgi:hypothetical protein